MKSTSAKMDKKSINKNPTIKGNLSQVSEEVNLSSVNEDESRPL